MCLRSYYPSCKGGGGGFQLGIQDLDSIQHGWGQLQTPTQACSCKSECWSQLPSQLFQLTVLGRPALRAPFRAARDLTSFTLWLIGHRWGPESDGNPAAPKVPCSPASSPQPQAFSPGQEGPGEAGSGAESRGSLSPLRLSSASATVLGGDVVGPGAYHASLFFGVGVMEQVGQPGGCWLPWEQ